MKYSKESAQSQAFSALFSNAQRICFQERVNAAPEFFTFPFNEGIMKKFQFMVLNPFKPGSTSRNKESVEYRQGFTVEMDCCGLDLQREWFQAVLGKPTVANFSGNKSIHNHVIFSPAASPEQEKALIEALQRAFPFADWGVITDKARLCRTPGAIRDNGRVQEIEQIGERRLFPEIMSTLEAWTEGRTGKPETASAFMKALADGKLTTEKEALEGKTDGKRKFPDLRQALENLLLNGYGLVQDSFEYRALAGWQIIAGALDSEIEATRERAARKGAKAESEMLKAAMVPNFEKGADVAGNSWRSATVEALKGRAVEFYQAHGIERITRKGEHYRGFISGQHKSKTGGFVFLEDGRFHDWYSGNKGWYTKFLMAQGLDEDAAWKELARFAGVEAIDKCKFCGRHYCKQGKSGKESKLKRSETAKEILDILIKAKSQEHPQTDETAERALLNAVEGRQRVYLGKIPTGGGKTTAAAKMAKKTLLSDHGTFLYCGAIRNDMYQFAEILGGMLPKEEKPRLARQISIIASDSKDEITEHTRLVITHRGYPFRKGFFRN